jgi:rhamnogalacturonyl hydrolase YesR
MYVADSAAQTPTDSAVLASAKKYGRIMCNWFLKKNTAISTDYGSACAYYGICIFSEATKDTTLLNAVSQRYKTYLAAGKTAPVGSVDMNVHGIVPFELYRQTKYAQFLPVGARLADDEFSTAHSRSDSLSTYSRFWVDDMYMIGSLQTQAYKSTNTMTYIDNAARTLWRYGDSLQQTNGLYYHSYVNHALFYWGRGNGWAASSMSELLSVLPTGHPRYAAIMNSYLNQMSALYKYQDASGMWHQLIDDKTTFIESSCTAMFTFALTTGLDHGWLQGDTIKVAVKKGWIALVSNFDTVNGIKNVCIGLNTAADSANYTKHTVATGDIHGTGSFIWAATALIRLLGKPAVQIAMPEVNRISSQHDHFPDNSLYSLQGRVVGSAKSLHSRAMGGGLKNGVYIYKGSKYLLIP